ncbi:nitroreductase family deazaflavin-dependent oxidoreductase [Mycolicibacterium cosmeticum]|uniref:Deazaflavin-dependent nitroreductase family protein n=2 Tax=Mycolicibacterium cosmeticum TaxID=258533 RepID=W9B7Q0_MYCCO|nr:nitroreductase family deazaflavin-dependent oxidoreductase [Mycolicibacterium cosmeticum]TLH74073.1 nitroreductase family deazaflavin-dependent oxidoreductase [Mycolicibacterium cosmeticum]CDO11007.1 deazaflavin-dependent nitroreductase family protein [Mycolicibacterium cosmeticum]
MPNNSTQPAHSTLRRFNKRLLNPLMLKLAGRKHWYASVIQHVGRRTGKVHRTPVVAIPTATGLLIPLPYGADTDWLLNARTAGTATVTVGGERHEATNPRVIDSAAAAAALPARRRRVFERFGIDQFAEFDLATDTKEARHDR